MNAVRLHEFGGPEVLRFERIPKPQIASGEALIRVEAVGVNPPDLYLRDGYQRQHLPPGMRPSIELPAIPGSDIAGVVEATAPNVTAFGAGDEVFGMIRFPSFGDSAAYAEYVSAPAGDLARQPSSVDHAHAAATPMSGLTAWQFLVDVGHNEPNPLQPNQHQPVPLKGKTVLINGAAGGVGHFAVQLARWRGARVIAVASGRHQTFLRDLGVDDFIDYTEERPEEVVRNLDVVLDTVGGASTARFLRCIRRGGVLYPVFPGFGRQSEAVRRGVTVSMTQVRSSGRQLDQFAGLLADGTITAAIGSRFDLSDAAAAHARGERGHVQGKIVLTVR